MSGTVQGLDRTPKEFEGVVTVVLSRLEMSTMDEIRLRGEVLRRAAALQFDAGLKFQDVGRLDITYREQDFARDSVVCDVRGAAVETTAAVTARLRVQMAEEARDNMRDLARVSQKETRQVREQATIAAAQAEIDQATAVIAKEDELAGTIKRFKELAEHRWVLAFRMATVGGVLGAGCVVEGLALLHWL